MGLYSSGGSGRQTYTPEPLGGGGGSIDIEKPAAGGLEAGKGSLSLTDPAGSAGQTLASFGEFASNLAGGALGAIGSVGSDGETASLGQLVEDVGRIPGGIGDFKRPWDADDPAAPTLGQAAGMGIGLVGDVISAPGRFVEFEAAKNRARGGPALDPRALFGAGGSLGMLADTVRGADPQALPPELQEASDAGEMTVDQVAEELVNRDQGFTSDGATNLAAQVVLDPLNLIAPGASKLARGARGAGIAVRTADDIGIGQRAIGTTYNAATNGMSAAGAATVEKALGPITSGVFHTLGTKPYKALVGGAAKLDRSYGLAFERSFALGAGQLPRAIIAREVMNDVGSKLATRVANAERTIDVRLTAKRTAYNAELERRTEELLGRVTPDFSVITDDVTDATIRKYAATTGMSVEDATRTLGRVDRNTARTVHLAYYGHAGGELVELKKGIPTTKKLDVERLTVIAPDTLTDELADAIVAGDISVAEAVENFSVLNNHFGNKVVADSDVLAFIDKIRDTLPQAVRLPKSGKNALPRELGDWRARNTEFGYDLGFAPKDGWKSIVDEDGNVIMSDPFVHFTSDVDPVTMRNPLGRFMDGLMRGTTQTVIVQQSRQRMVDFVARAKLPISPNQTRSIHKAILEEAADRGLTPRALAGERRGGAVIYDDIFRRFLGADEYQELVAKYDPTFIVMHAFEGNWNKVGLTQKFTGAAKARPQGGAMIAKITESLYPKARFTYRPTFQAQEAIESPVFNALRGVTDREVPEELAQAYRALSEQPEFRYLTEANFLNIAGTRQVTEFMGANSRFGQAMGRFANIASRKEVARIRQTVFEHGEDFRDAVQKINPKFWRAMEEAYETTDPRIIADRFLAERLALGPGENIDEAMALIDEAAGTRIQAAYDAGDTAAGQAENIAEGVRRGGSAASGGAVKAGEAALPTSASDMVLQAFKDSFREASNRAFQTHFFNPQRGWLERTLNHPYLGLYPLSYMWGKVLPEFARFLLKRPFGMDAPLVGAVALARVQQAYVGALADDPEFAAYMQENEDAIYFANLLFPGNPTNLTVNAPAWLRHVTEDAAAGNLDDPGKTITREIVDSGSYATGPIHDLTSINEAGSDLVGIGEDIFAALTRSAQQYDNMFSQGAPRPVIGTPLAP